MRKKLGYVGRATLNLIAVLIVVFGFQAAIRGRVPDALGLGLMLVVLIITYLAGVRWIERRQATELTAREGPREFGAGAALGLGLFTAVMLILWIARAYQPTGWGGFRGIASGFLFALMAAVLEEILFRGLLFRLLAKIFGTWGALAITSVLFGAAHAFNRGATVWSSFAIALEAGMLLGAAYAVTQRLWMPIGLHVGWNFTEGSLFGMSVSGLSSTKGVVSGTLHGSAFLTGGAFGPEASIVAVVVCCVAAFILMRRIRRLGRVEPPIWVSPAETSEPSVLAG